MPGTPHGPDSFLLTFAFAHAHQMRCFSTPSIMPATMHVSTGQGVGNIFAGSSCVRLGHCMDHGVRARYERRVVDLLVDLPWVTPLDTEQ